MERKIFLWEHFYLESKEQSWARDNSVATMWQCYQAIKLFVISILLLLCSVTKGVKRQAKGVYYVFPYKQHMDNVYTLVAIRRFTIGSLLVDQSSTSPPQSWVSTLAREYRANLTLWLPDAEPIFSPFQILPAQIPSLPLSLFSGQVKLQSLDSLDEVYWDWLTLSESEYCPTSFPTVYPKVPYK